MIIPDVNILIYAYNSKCPEHKDAKEWWERTINGRTRLGLTWVSILGFLRILTNPRIIADPLPARLVTASVRSWLAHPNVDIVAPGNAHADIFLDFRDLHGASGNLTTDAHLAAMAIEYSAEIATTDKYFAKFPGVMHFNLLARRPH